MAQPHAPLPDFQVEVDYDTKKEYFLYRLSENFPQGSARGALIAELSRLSGVTPFSIDFPTSKTVRVKLSDTDSSTHASVIRRIIERGNIYTATRTVTVRMYNDGRRRFIPLEELERRG